jgi:signal transduction histidine kinase
MPDSKRRIRRVQIGFALLLVVTTAQAAWWTLDQWLYTAQVRRETEAMQQQLVAAAEALLAAGASAERVLAEVPGVVVGEDNRIVPDPAVVAEQNDRRDRRLNRYFWEGGFFITVLVAAVVVLGRAVSHEAQLRRRQQNFLAAVSHELRSPLASARLAAETLEMRDPPADERRRLIDRLMRNLGRLETMVTNLLDTARLEAGSLAVTSTAVDLREVAQSTLAAYADRAAGEGVGFTGAVAEGLVIIGDPEATRTILRNLVENAFHAVRESDVPTVSVEARRVDGNVRLQVIDNGCGFEPTQASMLFEKFYRPGDELRRGGQGAGLGLYIVRELAARSGARVTAYSEGGGQGATFTVEWTAGGHE